MGCRDAVGRGRGMRSSVAGGVVVNHLVSKTPLQNMAHARTRHTSAHPSSLPPSIYTTGYRDHIYTMYEVYIIIIPTSPPE